MNIFSSSGANGVYQNSIYGTAAFLPMKYTNAVVTGSVSNGGGGNVMTSEKGGVK